jgi:hypothetical protein
MKLIDNDDEASSWVVLIDWTHFVLTLYKANGNEARENNGKIMIDCDLIFESHVHANLMKHNEHHEQRLILLMIYDWLWLLHSSHVHGARFTNNNYGPRSSLIAILLEP